jgi:hypothetical protein
MDNTSATLPCLAPTSRQLGLNQRNLTPTRPNLLNLKSRLVQNRAKLLRCPLNTINTRHHGNIPAMAEPRMVAVVSRQRGRRRLERGIAQRRVHDLVADEQTRVRGHAGADAREDLDRVVVGPVVPGSSD